MKVEVEVVATFSVGLIVGSLVNRRYLPRVDLPPGQHLEQHHSDFMPPPSNENDPEILRARLQENTASHNQVHVSNTTLAG